MAGNCWSFRGGGEAKKQNEEKERRRASANEFFLKPSEQRDIVFLEDVKNGTGLDATFAVYRHALTIDGAFPPTPVTCSRDMDTGCPVCRRKWKDSKGEEHVFKREMFFFTSIVDLTPWERDGKRIPATRRLLVMRLNLFERLVGKSDRRRETGFPNGIKMWAFNVRRTPEMRGKQDVSWKTGNEFEPTTLVSDPFKPLPFVRMKDAKGVDIGPHPGLFGADDKPLDIAPDNYDETLKPKEPAEIDRIFQTHAVVCGLTYKADGGSPEASSAPASAAAGVKY